MKQKRINIILGGKGGVGKTTLARVMVEALSSRKIPYIAFDADPENPDLFRYYKEFGTGVTLLEFLEAREARNFFTALDEKAPQTVLIDLPAGQSRQLREIFESFGLFRIAEQLGYRVTLVSVLDLGIEPINSLSSLLEFCQDNADYVVVKNLYWDNGDGFSSWQNSRTRTRILELTSAELNMPKLDPNAYTEVRKKFVPFSLATRQNGFPFGDYLLVDSFLIRAKAELFRAAELLGLESEAADSEVQAGNNTA